MRIAIIAIFIQNDEAVDSVNNLLHEFGGIVLGRFGLPRIEENLNVITLVVKAEQKEISAFSGKIGRINDVVCQVTYAKV